MSASRQCACNGAGVVQKHVEVEVRDRSWFRDGSLSIDTECFSDIQSFETPSTAAPTSPGSARSRTLGLLDSFNESVSGVDRKLCWGLSLDSPRSDCSEAFESDHGIEPNEQDAYDFTRFGGNTSMILFDFDGTLTSTPGEFSHGSSKKDDLVQRSSLLRSHLEVYRAAGIVLGIVSKSTLATIQACLAAASLTDLFNGPIVAKAVGLEGKAGFIKQLVRYGHLACGGPVGIHEVLLVDDDLSELSQAVEMGIQTYAVTKRGGLNDCDFNAIRAGIGL